MSALLCLTPNPHIAGSILTELQACGCQPADLSLIPCAAPRRSGGQPGPARAHRAAQAAVTGIHPLHALATRRGIQAPTRPHRTDARLPGPWQRLSQLSLQR